jgi:hypothetical protein
MRGRHWDKRFTIRIDSYTLEALERLSIDNEQSRADIMRGLILSKAQEDGVLDEMRCDREEEAERQTLHYIGYDYEGWKNFPPYGDGCGGR